ncbi:MAG TPA: Sua5/YciO/YrdC/YwlC family protein, partial [Cryomorphaceae bacterium]|nr:Sua5/YciO/YrdC/YwlC family protein [Cryomorphaceae bacterium]
MEEISLKETAQKIRDGSVIVAPLPSGYALICDARNDEPVKRLRKIKRRSAEKGFTILVESDARLNKYVKDVPAIAWDIIDTAENPLVLILPNGSGVCREALA